MESVIPILIARPVMTEDANVHLRYAAFISEKTCEDAKRLAFSLLRHQTTPDRLYSISLQTDNFEIVFDSACCTLAAKDPRIGRERDILLADVKDDVYGLGRQLLKQLGV